MVGNGERIWVIFCFWLMFCETMVVAAVAREPNASAGAGGTPRQYLRESANSRLDMQRP